MLEAEYNRFLQTLDSEGIIADVRKIAKLVFEHLETLTPLTTSQGQRIKKIVDLAQSNWNSISSDIQRIEEHEETPTCPFTIIKSLTVGPFRGFVRQEDFDLSSKLVLIYGPNGTGKSSFCEALEYCLLGNVTEAEIKRFRNQNDYLKNAYTNSLTLPILLGKDDQETDFPITSNESLYRFCFIEKNRIDNFSRIAAQAPAKQSELISTLFGLDDFSEFARNCSDSMDKYIDLVGIKAKELNEKRQTLAGCKQLVETALEELQKLSEDEDALAQEFRSGCTFSQMVLELNGSYEDKGLIERLEAELEKPIGANSGLTLSDLRVLDQLIQADIRDLAIKEKELTSTSQLISYKQLYSAVIQMKEISIERCPACHTPLSQVIVDPFKHAEVELEKLQYLGKLQDEVKDLNDSIGGSLINLSQIINACCLRFSDNMLLDFNLKDVVTPTVSWWDSLHQQIGDGITPWQYLESQIKQLEDTDKENATNLEMRNEKQIKIKSLRKFAENIVKLQTRRETANNSIKTCKEEIDNFNTQNASLIGDAESEKEVVAQNQAISNAYTIFAQKLNDYKNNLPTQLVADLGETIVQLYNAFNRHDLENEQLAIVRLPLQQNERLEISFKTDPNTFFDALHILSEGHIRCMGLAILSAKNIKEGCPILIFDDPVNAIDDDHRESIRKTMFEDDFFGSKQIILACHGEEFFKDIQNMLAVERARQIKTVSFLQKIEGSHIHIDHNCSPRNYVIAARTHFDRSEIRDALDKSRKALESLAKGKIWSYVCKFGDGNLSIKLRSPTAPIELRNLTEQLKSKIDKINFADQNKMNVLNPLESLLGINGDSREWRYLNKGTHEEADRAEFDRQTVNEIVAALEMIDAALA